MPDYRVIPSIEQLRQRDVIRTLERDYGRGAIVQALRDAAAEVRAGLAAAPLDPEAAALRVERLAHERLSGAARPSLRPVINATGVVIHTNLGRSPLAGSALERMATLAAGYSNLEFDLERGGRGARDVHAEALLCRLLQVESAVVVNNNAAATMLMLAALAAGREVIVSRGELVEIGGGFRVPDVMEQSGARLREVGTTNRTRAADYAAAIGDRTALLLRVHRSNFRIEGFTEQPRLEELVTLGREKGIPVAEDLGSGYMGVPGDSDADARLDAVLDGEPRVQQSLSAGVDICCFSGDKLLGGPQAGIVVGRRELVERIRRHPLMRALRVDKLTYAALEATLGEYVSGRAARTVPVLRMALADAAGLESRGVSIKSLVDAAGPHAVKVEIVPGQSTVGGGTTPGLEIATRLLSVTVEGLTPDGVDDRLRRRSTPIVGRIENGRFLLDLRTILPEQDEEVATAIRSLRR
jgi:L-seryl-tRNA(Ser) seleniumtransferase